MTTAADRWAAELAAWAIPDEILAAAPESPWGFPPALFQAPDADVGADTPSRRRALEALAPGGVVLDVGAGGGAASVPLSPPAGRLVAVDESAGMLPAWPSGPVSSASRTRRCRDGGPTWRPPSPWPTWSCATTSSTTSPT